MVHDVRQDLLRRAQVRSQLLAEFGNLAHSMNDHSHDHGMQDVLLQDRRLHPAQDPAPGLVRQLLIRSLAPCEGFVLVARCPIDHEQCTGGLFEKVLATGVQVLHLMEVRDPSQEGLFLDTCVHDVHDELNSLLHIVQNVRVVLELPRAETHRPLAIRLAACSANDVELGELKDLRITANAGVMRELIHHDGDHLLITVRILLCGLFVHLEEQAHG
mmetsp:Transcript_13754/g.30274  ORF Transcript_13754/g.30274 Transcript_13754/m.30274 type:complete len:216 (-) Transcript_13754:392-1039(-)